MIFTKTFKVFIYCIFITFFTSCDIINKPETVPSYIRINSFSLQTDNNTQGANSQDITDVWLNVDLDQTEVYELPVTIPLLKIGKHKIIAGPGITVNGIAANRKIYPFYEDYKIDTTLNSEQITILNPVVKYKSATIFELLENFEDPAFAFKKSDNSDTSLIQVNDPIYPNNMMGEIYLTDSNFYFECITESFNLPKNGIPVYLELSYQNDIEFSIGVYAKNATNFTDINYLTLNPSGSKRKKVYVDLTYTISSNADATYYIIYIRAKKPTGTAEAKIYLDDIKLLHF